MWGRADSALRGGRPYPRYPFGSALSAILFSRLN
jgi:hypothetical protein